MSARDVDGVQSGELHPVMAQALAPFAPPAMTPEQRTRALTHYTAEASVALRIEQLEGLLRQARPYIDSFAAMTRHPTAPQDASALSAQIKAALANVEAARTGANT
jgi:hypothetical protein